MTHDQFKERMRAKVTKVRGEFAQMVMDIESWNDNRTDAPPFDCGAEKVLVQLCDQSLEALDRDDMPEFDRLSQLILEQCERAAGIEPEVVTP